MNGWGRITLVERNEHRKHAVFKNGGRVATAGGTRRAARYLRDGQGRLDW
jgi:hypothetical protein